MRRAALFATILVLALVRDGVGAQAAVSLSAGVLGSRALIKDNEVNTTLTPVVGPLLGVNVLIPTGGAYRLVLGVRGVHSDLDVSDAVSGEQDVLTALTVIDATAMFEGPIRGAFRWRLGGGAIFYLPSDHIGVFQDGSMRRWLVAGAVTYRHPLSPGLQLVAAGQVDYHQFVNDVLLSRGFAGGQSIERFSLQLGVERNF